MSDLDVHRIICPTIEQERDQLLQQRKAAEEHVVFLRKALGELVERYAGHQNPLKHAGVVIEAERHGGIPHPYDGTGWAMLQERAKT